MCAFAKKVSDLDILNLDMWYLGTHSGAYRLLMVRAQVLSPWEAKNISKFDILDFVCAFAKKVSDLDILNLDMWYLGTHPGAYRLLMVRAQILSPWRAKIYQNLTFLSLCVHLPKKFLTLTFQIYTLLAFGLNLVHIKI